MTKTLKTAIIGYGIVGKRRKLFIERNKNYKLLYISDIKFKKNIKSKTIIFFKNYKEILKHNIDVVFITLPTYLALFILFLHVAPPLWASVCEYNPYELYL